MNECSLPLTSSLAFVVRYASNLFFIIWTPSFPITVHRRCLLFSRACFWHLCQIVNGKVICTHVWVFDFLLLVYISLWLLLFENDLVSVSVARLKWSWEDLLASFFIALTKHLKRCNLREGGLILTHGWSAQSITAGDAWRWDWLGCDNSSRSLCSHVWVEQEADRTESRQSWVMNLNTPVLLHLPQATHFPPPGIYLLNLSPPSKLAPPAEDQEFQHTNLVRDILHPIHHRNKPQRSFYIAHVIDENLGKACWHLS